MESLLRKAVIATGQLHITVHVHVLGRHLKIFGDIVEVGQTDIHTAHTFFAIT